MRTMDGVTLRAMSAKALTRLLAQMQVLNLAGVDAVVPMPPAGGDLAALRAEIAALAPRPLPPLMLTEPAPRGRIVAVAQARGGVGATTIAVNLAHELAGRSGFLKKAAPRPVALVDLDLQFGSVGTLLDLEDQDALHQMALEGVLPDKAFLDRVMPRTENGLAVLAAPSKFMPLDA